MMLHIAKDASDQSDNDKILVIEVASEYELPGKAIKREQITSGPDSPRVIELRMPQSTALKRVLGNLVQKPCKPRQRSRAKLELLDPQIDE